MFSRWGAFVYRHRRIVLILAIALGLGATTLAGKASAELSAGGWLDPNSESQAVADRLARDFGGGRGTLIPIFAGAPGTDATAPAFQATIADSLRDLEADPSVDSVIGYAQTGDKRFISEDGESAYVVVALNVTDEESVPLLDRFESELHQPTDGTRLLLGGYAPLTRDSAEQSETGPRPRGDRIAAHRGGDPDAGLRDARRCRTAAARRRPGHPVDPRPRVLRRPGDRDQHLRPEHLDDARPGARDRLLAVHGQPLPGGAPTRQDRRGSGRDLRRDQRQGRGVLRSGGRHRPRWPDGVQRTGPAFDRHRRCAHRRRVRVLRPDVPAGTARHPRAARRRAEHRRASRRHPSPARAARSAMPRPPPPSRAGSGSLMG